MDAANQSVAVRNEWRDATAAAGRGHCAAACNGSGSLCRPGQLHRSHQDKRGLSVAQKGGHSIRFLDFFLGLLLLLLLRGALLQKMVGAATEEGRCPRCFCVVESIGCVGVGWEKGVAECAPSIKHPRRTLTIRTSLHPPGGRRWVVDSSSSAPFVFDQSLAQRPCCTRLATSLCAEMLQLAPPPPSPPAVSSSRRQRASMWAERLLVAGRSLQAVRRSL